MLAGSMLEPTWRVSGLGAPRPGGPARSCPLPGKCRETGSPVSEVPLWERLVSGTFQAFLEGKSEPSELLLKTLFNNER